MNELRALSSACKLFIITKKLHKIAIIIILLTIFSFFLRLAEGIVSRGLNIKIVQEAKKPLSES